MAERQFYFLEGMCEIIYMFYLPQQKDCRQEDLLIIHLLLCLSAYVSVFFVAVECKQLTLAETIKAIL